MLVEASKTTVAVLVGLNRKAFPAWKDPPGLSPGAPTTTLVRFTATELPKWPLPVGLGLVRVATNAPAELKTYALPAWKDPLAVSPGAPTTTLVPFITTELPKPPLPVGLGLVIVATNPPAERKTYA